MNYYLHTCKCGCGKQIEIRGFHKYDGIPLFLKGHHLKGKSKSEETINKYKNSMINFYKNGGKVWNKGLTKEMDDRVKENGIKVGKSLEIYFIKEENRSKLSLKMKGKNHSKETKQKLRKANQGSNHPQWQNGKSFEEYGIEFNKELKDYIRNRDMYICQTPDCMNIGNLCVHHIDYNKQNNNFENLVTLCNSCHSKTNFNRDYYTNYYQEILNAYL